MGINIEIQTFNEFWQDCGSDPYNSYEDKNGIYRCRRILNKPCNAKNCPDFNKHIKEIEKQFKSDIKLAKGEEK